MLPYPSFSSAEMLRRRELVAAVLSEAEVAHLVIYGANRAAAGFSPTGKHRALAGAGVNKFTKRLKIWLEDFF